MPECLGESSPVGLGVEPIAILGMIEYFLDEPLDGLACLNPQLLGDPGLLKAGLVHDVRQGLHTLRAAKRHEQEERIRDLTVSFPAWVQGDDDLGVESGRIGDQNPELDSVGEDAQSLASCQQDTLGDPQMTEPIGTPSLRGRIQIFIERRGPDAKLVSSVCGEQEISATLQIFPSLNIIRGFQLRVAQQFDQGLDDLVPHSEGTSTRGKLLKVSAVQIPLTTKLLPFVPELFRQQLTGGEFLFEFKADEWNRQGWPKELAVRQVKSHGSPPGRA